MGSAEHRAIAREAVRKSLVLLKNNGVLPVKASAPMCWSPARAPTTSASSPAAGPCRGRAPATPTADFPNAQSIWSGLKDAVEAGGGKASLSVDGKFDTKPDVAIVVFGETPYAEGVGDLKTAGIPAGAKTDLALLKRLKAAGVPVVAVFLTGRPAVGKSRDQRLGRLRQRLAAGLGRRRDRRRADRRQGRQAAHRLPRQAVVQLAQDRRPVL
jgi:beta-glucosidase